MRPRDFRIGLVASLALSGCIGLAQGEQHPASSPQGLAIARQYSIQADILAVELERGQVDYAQQVPYEPQSGDRIAEDGSTRWLERNGAVLGSLVGPDQALLYGFDRYRPAPGSDRFDPERSEQPRRYRLSSPDDPAYADPRAPEQVFRKSRPVDMAQTGPWEKVFPTAHSLYFRWPSPLIPGRQYRLETTDGSLQPLSFRHQPRQTVSEAVQVNQIGFRPDEPKLAFLSSWLGSGGGVTYDPQLRFEVIDQATETAVYQGQIELRRGADEPEDPRGRNYNGTAVYAMAFDDLTRPGDYRLCVETVGCSQSFPIAANPWQGAFETAARGFYYQRSGIALGAPHSDRPRPRPFFPGDGQLKIYQSKATLLETGNGLADSDTFSALVAGKTSQVLPEAWGGYFDAGDWDRRIQHLEAARALLELAELFPEAIAQTPLNLPESDNGLPDLIDEALWGIDFFRRLQLPDGGIRGGIESADHPRRGETSWQESLPVMAYAPDVWSSYVYAGVAAQAASVLRQWDGDRAQLYRASALAAMAYAETQPQRDALPHAVRDARNLAALELWRLTQDPQWHQLFLATTVFVDPAAPMFLWEHQDQHHAAFLYARLPANLTQPTLQANARRALLAKAEGSITLSNETGFAWTRMEPWQPLGWSGSFGNPKLTTLLRAHALTQDEKYLKTALRAGQFSAGANPLNMTFTTGVGHRSPQHPLVVDPRVLGQPPAPGLTVYGPLDMVAFGDDWAIDMIAPQVYPEIRTWPATESYFDIYLFPAVAEFTIMETMTPLTYAWGYFSARNVTLSPP